jgi:DNA repair protein RadC
LGITWHAAELSNKRRLIVRESGYRKQLKERFLKIGLKGFLDAEVLELMLIYAKPTGDVKPIARALLENFGGIRGILDADIRELISLRGMDTNSAILIKMANDYPDFYLKDRVLQRAYMNCWMEIVKYCQLSMSGLKEEQFRVIFLDAQNQVVEMETLHVGTINKTVVYPRKVIERALANNAAGMIFVHNHPNGSPQPSAADKEVTNMLAAAASSVNIEVHDHLIIGRTEWFSFKDAGLLVDIPMEQVSVHMKRAGGLAGDRIHSLEGGNPETIRVAGTRVSRG